MTPVIDLDQITGPAATTAQTGDMSFRTWLDQWAPRHPAAVGAAAGVAVAIVATIAGLLAVILIPPAGSSAVARVDVPHTISISAPAGAELTETVVQRAYSDGGQDLVLRGDTAAEFITTEPASVDNVVSVSVTVRAPQASCAITVDGHIVDQAQALGVVSCIWVGPPASGRV
jgi:hypothetical protein